MLLQILSEAETNYPWWNAIVENTDVQKLLSVLYEIGFTGDFVLGGEGGSKMFSSYIERHEPRFEEVQIHGRTYSDQTHRSCKRAREGQTLRPRTIEGLLTSCSLRFLLAARASSSGLWAIGTDEVSWLASGLPVIGD